MPAGAHPIQLPPYCLALPLTAHLESLVDEAVANRMMANPDEPEGVPRE